MLLCGGAPKGQAPWIWRLAFGPHGKHLNLDFGTSINVLGPPCDTFDIPVLNDFLLMNKVSQLGIRHVRFEI